MAPLDKSLFLGRPHVDGAELARGEVVNNSASVDNALKNFNWNGKAVGVVVLNLSADNRQIESAEFVSRGELEDREIRMDILQTVAGCRPGNNDHHPVPTVRQF